MERQTSRDDLDIPAPTYRLPAARRGWLEMDTRRLALTAGFGFCGLVLVATGWAVLSRGRPADVPTVSADTRPLRVRPENPGGLQVSGQNETILSGDPRAGLGQLAPPPEAPAIQALRERQAAEEAARRAAEAARAEAARAEAARAEAARAEAAAPARPQTVSLPPAGGTQAAVTPPPVAAVPSAAPPRPPAASAAPAAAPAPAPRPAAPGGGGKALAQLAAVGSEQAAREEWQRLVRRMPDLFGGLKPVFSRFERDGKVFWRVRAGGFADAGQASTFCGKVKAKGGACTVATF